MIDVESGPWERKKALYGCLDCLKRERKECKANDPCAFAATLDLYENYYDYLKRTDPVILDGWEEKRKETTNRLKLCNVVLKNLDTGETYRTVVDAAKKLGVDKSRIYEHLNGMYSVVHGQHLAYVQV